MRPVLFVGASFAAFLVWLNDADHFTVDDLADTFAHGTLHHEIVVLVLVVVAVVALIVPRKSRARRKK